MASHTQILKLNDLSIGYKNNSNNKVIAKGINVNLEQGNLVCILGKNGIGKSTLLRTIANVQNKLDGEVLLENEPIEKYSSLEIAKRIALVLTEKVPTGNLTVYDLIALGRQPYTNWIGTLTFKDKEHIDFAIEQTKIGDLLDSRCDELSDGQLQRVMICRALAQNTPLIVLDEPTAHLDIQNKINTFKLLQKLSHDLNKTILLCTHEVQLAIQLADVLWLMSSKGLKCGDAETLIDNRAINDLFDSSVVHFDPETNQFLVK